MDEFDNFFDEPSGDGHGKTPIYHTPDGKDPKRSQNNRLTVISVCVAVFMCLVVIVNVIVLSALKNEIASDYSASIADTMKEQYYNAISDSLNDSEIVKDVTNIASEKATDLLSQSVTEIVGDKYMKYVAVVNCSTSSSSQHDASSGTASGFVIGTSEKLYLVTNAHVIMTAWTKNGGQSLADRSMHEHESITCLFEESDDDNVYSLKVVAVGTYQESYTVYSGYGMWQTSEKVTVSTDVTNQPDLAICEFVGTQPDFTADGSAAGLSIATSDTVKIGDEIAIVGNPQGIGLSMSNGIVSKNDFTISSWGAGKFIMTDGAINGGNSGGPMINRYGKVVGVVESKLVADSIENMGFGVASSSLIDFIKWANEQYGINVAYSIV